MSTVAPQASPATVGAASTSTVPPPPAGVAGGPKPAPHSVLRHGPPKPLHREGVRFGGVEIFEHERMYMDSPVSGVPRLVQGPAVGHVLRRMDSLEEEREPVRHHREDIQPLTPAQRRELAGMGRELLSEVTRGAAPPSAPTAPPAAPTGFDAELDNWHLGPDGSVYHNGGVTSKVTAVTGRVVTTAAHGSRYRLGTLKGSVREVLTRLNIAFDPEAPLTNVASLVYAWTIVKVTPEMQQCRDRIQDLQTKLDTFGPSVKECFGTIDKAFKALGFAVQ